MTALILATHEAAREAQGTVLFVMALVFFAAIVGILLFLRRETRQRRMSKEPAEPETEPKP